MTRSSLLRAGATAGLGALLLLPPTTADAHVRVSADSTVAGSFSALTFRVPNESGTAGTVAVSVQLPQDTPFLHVSSKPVTGWRVATTEAPLPTPVESYGTTLTKAVRMVTWTAEKGARIAPGEYQEFSLQVGPLPAASTVLLPATQTYSDGEVVRWDEPTPTGGEEPEHPAPALVITAAAAEPTTTASPAPPASVDANETAGPDTFARILGGAGLVLGLTALAVAGLGRRRPGTSA